MSLGTGSFCHAATIVWEGGAAGDFDVPGNWDGPVPGSSDIAVFNDAGAVVVGFNQNESILRLNFNGVPDAGPPVVAPRLTFNLDTHTLEVVQTLDLDNSGSEPKTFVLDGGTLDMDSSVGVNRQNSSSTLMILRLENGATLDINGQFGISHQNNAGPAETHVVEGSSLIVNNRAWIAAANSGVGTLRLEGANSSFAQVGTANNHLLQIASGSSSSALVEILDGASVSTDGSINLARNPGSEGTILVSGHDSVLSANHQLYIGGDAARTNTPQGDVEPGGTALVTFENGASGDFSLVRTLANDPGNDEIGTLTLDRTAGVTTTNATFDPGSILRFGLHEADQSADLLVNNLLNVDGATLEVFMSQGFTPSIGEQFALASYDSLNGLFANPQGRVIVDGTYYFEIDYNLNGGNFVGLTAIPEPTSLLLVMLTLGATVFRPRTLFRKQK